MAIQTSAGSTFAIATALPGTYDATGYNALTWQNIGEVTDIGEFGKEYNLVSHTPVAGRQMKKFKGSYNNGAIALQMARDQATSSNQDKLKTALASDASYAFRVTLQDGTRLYFTGKVMSYKSQVGSVDQMTGASCAIEIDNDIVEV
jgi:hypothetical protein